MLVSGMAELWLEVTMMELSYALELVVYVLKIAVLILVLWKALKKAPWKKTDRD
jgi:hypothetical protein